MAGDIPYYPHWLLSEAQEMVKTFNGPDPFREELEALYRLHAAKRSDYTADSGDILANYRFSAEMMGVPIERGMFGRMAEKFFRLKSIFEKGGDVKVSDETVQDTLRDIAIICVLLKLELDRGH